jgi:hypothetical protein
MADLRIRPAVTVVGLKAGVGRTAVLAALAQTPLSPHRCLKLPCLRGSARRCCHGQPSRAAGCTLSFFWIFPSAYSTRLAGKERSAWAGNEKREYGKWGRFTSCGRLVHDAAGHAAGA